MKIRYYRVNSKNQRAYWCPSPAMQAVGFEVKPLGVDGPEARAAAEQWNVRWQIARRERPRSPARGRRTPGSRETEKASFIYFLRVSDRIKIGTSSTPHRRVADLTTAISEPVTSFVVVRGNREDERRLHKRFGMYRTRGEWFVAARPLRLTIMRSAGAGRVVHDGTEAETSGSEKLNRNRYQNTGSVESQNGEALCL